MEIIIKSKHDIGERVYFLEGKKIKHGCIKEITYNSIVKEYQLWLGNLIYKIEIFNKSGFYTINLPESETYSTIDDLILDLIDNKIENRIKKVCLNELEKIRLKLWNQKQKN